MTEYETGLPVHVIAMKPPPLKNILGQVVSDAGIAQFRCAETEKNPHVTFFFQQLPQRPVSGRGAGVPAEPKGGDLRPAARDGRGGGDGAVKAAILSGKFGFLVVNYANPDMVGHTGSLPAAISAVEATDRGVGSCSPRWRPWRQSRDLRRPWQLRARCGISCTTPRTPRTR